MELTTLPTEIHYHLQTFLDHPSLLNLSATSKYFRSLCPESKVRESLLCLEKCSLETETLLTTKELLPCYTCFKALPSFDHFPPAKHAGEYKIASKEASHRICATCLVATRQHLIRDYLVALRDRAGRDIAMLPKEPHPDWVFYVLSSYKECKLYAARNYDFNSDYYGRTWLECPNCKLVKRYLGSPFRGHRCRYDEALMEGHMCATCYQPVWDVEDELRRERKNARARERYREKKEEARKRKEAEALTVEHGSISAATIPVTSTVAIPTTALPLVTSPDVDWVARLWEFEMSNPHWYERG